ncbi:HLH-domain-containing protein [Lophium mytilinum]|uniref:HLH-domain-containing protein n=1 Tax=Lophium mytilinum TaxID=390894 RepID=A0A6A6QW01_9PEZI|nr:HLH-domain-containing protein [Lophium mytilinum]
MPRPLAPPTPAPSNDIAAKPHDTTATTPSAFDASFILPPAALSSGRASSSSASSGAASDSSYRPLSPTSPAASKTAVPRKRPAPGSSGGATKAAAYALPPPPTRSRKIIQMKPPGEAKGGGAGGGSGSSGGGAGTTTGKKKASGGPTPTAAGRKIARKTAHSLIERRRRSKMNEEFGVLKDMIPACVGQEMHKLAILQASIDYMRYLEQCVVDLKASHRSRRPSPAPASPQTTPPVRRPMDDGEDMDEEVEEEDEEMSDAISPTQIRAPVTLFPPPLSNTTCPALYPSDRNPSVYSAHASPDLHASDVRARHYSVTTSPALQPSDPHRYSLTSSLRSTAASPSIQASPAFSAQSGSAFRNPFSGSVFGPGQGGRDTFSLTSPALGPQPDERDCEDREATEALLMLNTDRRSWSARGMSVRDLLSG